MRLVLLTQIVAAGLLLCGCPGGEQTDPSGGPTGSGAGSSASTESGTGAGFATASAVSGTGGDGNSGSGGEGAGNTGSGGAGAGNTGSGGAGAGNTGSGGAGAGDVTSSAASGSSSGAGGASNCAPLDMNLQVTMVEAQKCYPKIDIPQCNQFFDGPCCPINVAFQNSPEVQAYLDAFKAWKDSGCTASCPPIPCPDMPTGKCTPDTPGSDSGVCAVIPPP